jgi:phosphatidylserine/phosphatidylglycerophosphate/cardiolipin synthase-like enzyme
LPTSRPHIYYDPRFLSDDSMHRSSLHAKCIIADRQRALITSANFTEAAWLRNIELGVLLNYQPVVSRVRDYFDGLVATYRLLKCEM